MHAICFSQRGLLQVNSSVLTSVYLFVLVGRDGDEVGFSEDKSPEVTPWQLQNVVGLDDVEARLVFVHRV